MNFLFTAGSTTWLSLQRSTSERLKGTEGQTHDIHVPKCPHFKNLQLTSATNCCLWFVYSDQRAKKGKEGREPADMVKFSKVKSGVRVGNVHVFCILLELCDTDTRLDNAADPQV